jgi:competence protein ComEC
MIGIYAASRLEIPLLGWVLAAALPICVAWLWRAERRVRQAALCGLFVILGAIRYVAALPGEDEHSVAAYNDRGWAVLTGVVAGEPDVRDRYVNLRVRAQTLARTGQVSVAVRGLVLVRAPRYPVLLYGDRIEARGQLETPPAFETFSYADYLARQGIYSTMGWARVKALDRGQGNALFAALLRAKERAQRAIAEVLPEPCAALLTGILLGIDSGLPAELAADFRITGTSHIIAISGFNMAILAGLFSRLSVRIVGRRYAAWFCTAALALYTVFVGASAAVVRAALMGAIAVWGEHFGRQNTSVNALFAAALLMTIWNPNTLWDLGFLLSFAATLGLISLAEPLSRHLERLLARFLPAAWSERIARALNEPLVLTTCAQLTTLPIILQAGQGVSAVTLLSNILVLPAQQQVMLWGALATLGRLLWLPLGRLLGWIAWPFLAWTIWVVEQSARLAREMPGPEYLRASGVWAWYAALGVGGWWLWQAEGRRRMLWHGLRDWLGTHTGGKVLLAGLAVAVVLVWAAVFSLPDGRLHVTFLDVGAGDAVWIETPSGRQILVNGGPSGRTLTAHLGRRMPFWDRDLDLVLVTGSEDEHLFGLASVLERYRVGRLWHPLAGTEMGATAQHLLALVSERGVPAPDPLAGTQIALGDGVVLSFIRPVPPEKQRPAVTLVRLDYGTTCFLLSASLNLEIERQILAQGEHLRCDVLQVGGQGGPDATSLPYLEAVDPTLAIISCAGEGKEVPDERTLARLTEAGTTIARTDELGSIDVISDGTRYEVRPGH